MSRIIAQSDKSRKKVLILNSEIYPGKTNINMQIKAINEMT